MSKRLFLVGTRDYDGGAASPLPHCTGSCHGSRRPCDCLTGHTELAGDIAPDASRVIQPPIRTPDDDSAIARIRCGTVALVMAGFCLLAGLLELLGASPFELPK